MSYFNKQYFDLNAEAGQTTDPAHFSTALHMRPKPTHGSILWPALGFPAVIAPRDTPPEDGSLRRPYLIRGSNQPQRTEILHPLFVRRDLATSDLKVHHITDTHVNVRADVYEENLKKQNVKASYSNWNKNFLSVYNSAKNEAHVMLLTGDLVDYDREHYGLQASHRLGDDHAYHLDRNWFLFHYFLASGDSYRVPVYIILGNHDWRLNSYPPFAVAGAPKPVELFNDPGKLYTKPREGEGQADILDRRRREEILEENLRKAHGPGDKRKFSVYFTAESKWQLIWDQPFGVIKARVGLFFQTQTLDQPHTSIETSIESVARYLLAINPFLDYSFHLPGVHSVLMLDRAQKEDVPFSIAIGGKDWSYFLWELDDASAPGPKAKNCLTALQKPLTEEFIEAQSNASKAKLIGIHAPPIGPYPHWSDIDLTKGHKTSDSPAVTLTPDGKMDHSTLPPRVLALKAIPIPALMIITMSIRGMPKSYFPTMAPSGKRPFRQCKWRKEVLQLSLLNPRLLTRKPSMLAKDNQKCTKHVH